MSFTGAFSPSESIAPLSFGSRAASASSSLLAGASVTCSGISSGAVLPEKNSGTERIPETLEAAADIAEKSEFLKKYIPENLLEVLIRHSREEWKEYSSAYDKEAFEEKKYFCSL